jgi:hypothetical protein
MARSVNRCDAAIRSWLSARDRLLITAALSDGDAGRQPGRMTSPDQPTVAFMADAWLSDIRWS